MAKLTYIEIVGKKYPMSFSVMASKKIAKKYGSVEKVLNGLDVESGVTEEVLDSMLFVVELLIAQGCAYKNYFEKDVTPPEDAPIIDGKWTPLPREALEIALTVADIEELAEKLQECMEGGKQRNIKEVEVEEQGKNAEAGQE